MQSTGDSMFTVLKKLYFHFLLVGGLFTNGDFGMLWLVFLTSIPESVPF